MVHVYACLREREKMCVNVCVCERERERERRGGGCLVSVHALWLLTFVAEFKQWTLDAWVVKKQFGHDGQWYQSGS